MSRGSLPVDLRASVARVRERLTATGATRLVVVVGDVMLDRYVDGSSTRLSPEAPVPVVDVTAELNCLGGAANVATGLARLGASVVLVGMVGDDESGARVRALLADVARIDPHLVVDSSRGTTTKERVRVNGRHIMRIDREDVSEPDESVRAAIERATRDALDGADVLVVSDYAKGAVGERLVANLGARPCTVVDPKHVDVERYRGAHVFAPNRSEAIAAASRTVAAEAVSLEESVGALHARLPGTAIVVTCGVEGMVWSDHRGEDRDGLRHIPSLARKVDDVTGAGDSVVCGLAAALATGADLPSAINLAAAVAAMAVESPGTATPSWDQIDALIRSLID